MPFATQHDATREYARNVGMDNPDQAWILSPYDTWERNPFYAGPPVAHPEDDYDLDVVEPLPQVPPSAGPSQGWVLDAEWDEIPF